MIYSKHPIVEYTTTLSCGVVSGIGSRFLDGTETGWNLLCLIMDVEEQHNLSTFKEYDPDKVGFCGAYDALVAMEGYLDYWESLSSLKPKAFLHALKDLKDLGAYEDLKNKGWLEEAYTRAELLDPSPRVENNVVHVKFGR